MLVSLNCKNIFARARICQTSEGLSSHIPLLNEVAVSHLNRVVVQVVVQSGELRQTLQEFRYGDSLRIRAFGQENVPTTGELVPYLSENLLQFP